MPKCDWIETSINILPRHLSPCCAIYLPSHPLYLRKEDGNDIKIYKEFISGFYSKFKDNPDLCKGCAEKIEGNPVAITKELVFKRVMINIHQHLCNCKCVYCTIPTSLHPSIPPLQPLIEELERTHSINAKTDFSWGGGESSLYKDFYKVAPLLAARGYAQNVFSNGIVFSPVIADLLKNGNFTVTISIDSYDRNSFIQMKQVDKYDKVISTIEKYISSARDKKDVIIKYILTDKNNDVDGISKFLDICQNIGVKTILVSPDFCVAQAGAISEATKRAAKFIFSEAKRRGAFNWCGPFFSPLFESYAKEIFK